MKKNFCALLLFIVLSNFTVLRADTSLSENTRQKWCEDQIIVKFKKDVSQERIKQINSRFETEDIYTSPFAGFKRIRIAPGKNPEQISALYNSDPNVEYAEPDYYAYAHFVPNDQYYNLQWNFKKTGGINIEPVWDLTSGDPNAIVAVVDTGVAYENYKNFQLAPDLANTRFVAGYDFYRNDSHPNDEEGHGTHVTGTIAQSTNNSIGTAGIAYNCSIMPVRVLSKRGEAPYSTIADGVYFSADNGAKVINMSLGGTSNSITLRDAVAYAYNHGVTIVCSAGNEYQLGNPVEYPAAYDSYCIAVGATRYDRTRASYSNTGSYVDLVAPGGDLNVDQNGDGYGDGILQQTFGTNTSDWNYWFYSGTSMAAPHVSGAAALLVSAGVTHPDDVRDALQMTAVDLGSAGRDNSYGWGLINPLAALRYFFARGDFNFDGFVDWADLQILSEHWLENRPAFDIYPANGDNIINFRDLALLAANWSAN